MSVNTPHIVDKGEPTPAEYAEAAAWIARLHGPNRTVSVERGLRRWLDASPEHAAAFEAMTAAWEVTGRLPRTPFPRVSRWQRLGYREGFIRSAVAVASIAVLALGALFYVQRESGVATGVGEQRVLTLADGTRVTLNTDTRVKVEYDERSRVVELRSGEALFEVANSPERPFIVKAGDRQVRALGTSFVVRRDARELEVTLVEGKVAITGGPVAVSPGEKGPSRAEGGASAEIITLVPGQRLTLAYHAQPAIDEPAIDKVIAWRRGLVDFENTPLADAAAEMNRYSATRLVIEDPRAAAIPITGVFRAGDAASLAAAVARAYRLEIAESRGELRLSGAPVGVE